MMSRRRAFHPALLVMFGLLCAGVVSASPLAYSFTGGITPGDSGAFTQDDNVQYIGFTVLSFETVTIQSWGFGGGTNAASTTIPSGGFQPVLTVYDTSGGIEAQDYNGCGACNTDPATLDTWDAYISQGFLAGTYILAITEYNNVPYGPYWLGDSNEYGNGNFTSQPGAPGPFRFQDGSQRTGDWAVDISPVDYAYPIPEPASMALAGIGLFLFFAPRLSGRQRISKS